MQHLGRLLAALVGVVSAACQEAAESKSEAIAHELRNGRYAQAIRLIDSVLAAEPDSGLRNIRDMFHSQPDMEVVQGAATLSCDVSSAGLRLPLTVNGQHVSWLFDTGANFSFISDAEARRLGMRITDTSARASDLAGGSVAARTAAAERLTIGASELRGATFLVTPADEMPWTELRVGQQGILGLPIAMALGRVQWFSSGACSVGGFPPTDPSTTKGAVLFFERLFVMAQVSVEGTPVGMTLDTGNQSGTQLWPRFAREFPKLLAERATQSSARLTQIGGAADHPTRVIRDLHFGIGGADIVLPRVHVFSPPVGHEFSYGLLGVDALANARAVTIDLRAMRLLVQSE